MKTCFLVLGMHRSGTSALTRVLNLLGAQLPKNLMGASLGNDAGHWEPSNLVNIHDELLAALGSTWDDDSRINPLLLPSEIISEFTARIKQTINNEFDIDKPFVIKDPRICRFADFFIDILAQMNIQTKVIFISRNPLSVAQSLEKRNNFPLSSSMLLWLSHQLEAENKTRDVSAVYLQYEELMSNPIFWIRHLRQWLAVFGVNSETPEDVVMASLRSELMHYDHNANDLAVHGSVNPLVLEVYGALTRIKNDQTRSAESALLDWVRCTFKARQDLFLPAKYALNAAFDAGVNQEQNVPYSPSKDAVVSVILHQLRSIAANFEQNMEIVSKAEETSWQIASLTIEHSSLLQKQTQLSEIAEQLEGEVTALRNSTSWRVTAPLRWCKSQFLTRRN